MSVRISFLSTLLIFCAGCQIRTPAPESNSFEDRLSKVERKLAAIATTLGIEQEPTPVLKRDIPIGSSPIIGSHDAPHTMVAFIDIECGFCAKRFPDLLRWQKRYPKLLNVVVKHYPLVPRSEAVSAAAVALVANEFGLYEDSLIRLLEGRKQLGPQFYSELPEKMGIASAEFDSKRASMAPLTIKIIADDIALAKLLGVKGTPTVFLDGSEISGVDAEEIERLLGVKQET